jgi:hypothetical protein
LIADSGQRRKDGPQLVGGQLQAWPFGYWLAADRRNGNPGAGVRRHRVPCYRVLEDFRHGGKDKLGDRLGSLPYSLDQRDHIGGCHVACRQTAQLRNDDVVDMAAALLDRVRGQVGEFLFHVIGRQLAEALCRRPLSAGFLFIAGHVRALLNLGAGLGR